MGRGGEESVTQWLLPALSPLPPLYPCRSDCAVLLARCESVLESPGRLSWRGAVSGQACRCKDNMCGEPLRVTMLLSRSWHKPCREVLVDNCADSNTFPCASFHKQDLTRNANFICLNYVYLKKIEIFLNDAIALSQLLLQLALTFYLSIENRTMSIPTTHSEKSKLCESCLRNDEVDATFPSNWSSLLTSRDESVLTVNLKKDQYGDLKVEAAND